MITLTFILMDNEMSSIKKKKKNICFFNYPSQMPLKGSYQPFWANHNYRSKIKNQKRCTRIRLFYLKIYLSLSSLKFWTIMTRFPICFHLRILWLKLKMRKNILWSFPNHHDKKLNLKTSNSIAIYLTRVTQFEWLCSFFLTSLKGMNFDHDLHYSFLLFSSLLKKREEEKANELEKIVIKSHAFQTSFFFKIDLKRGIFWHF